MKTLTRDQIARAIETALKTNGYTDYIPPTGTHYLVGITNPGQHTTEVSMSTFVLEGGSLIRGFTEEIMGQTFGVGGLHQNKVDPSDITFGLWWDGESNLWHFNVIQIVSDKWEAIKLGYANDQKEIGIVENGKYIGSHKVDTFVRSALVMIQHASVENRTELKAITTNFNRATISETCEPLQEISHIDFHPEGWEESSGCFMIWSKLKNKPRPTLNFMYMPKDEMLKFATNIFRGYGINPLNVIEEEERTDAE